MASATARPFPLGAPTGCAISTAATARRRSLRGVGRCFGPDRFRPEAKVDVQAANALVHRFLARECRRFWRPAETLRSGATMLEWVWPYVLALAPAPLLVYWLAPPLTHRQAALRVPNVGAFRLAERSRAAAAGRRLPWRALLLWLAWLALLAAARRPQWNRRASRLADQRSGPHAGGGHLRQHGHRGHAAWRGGSWTGWRWSSRWSRPSSTPAKATGWASFCSAPKPTCKLP